MSATVTGAYEPSIFMIQRKRSGTVVLTVASYCPENEFGYIQTGDDSTLPLLCHYPVKAQYVSKDPDYLSCKKSECKKYVEGKCVVTTCSGTLKFHVINIRTDIEFVSFAGGFLTPCILIRSDPVSFANPNMPLYGHLSSTDSTGTSMRLTWVSGDNNPQQVHYGDGKIENSQVSSFSKDDVCNIVPKLTSPAKDFGWHDPGYIHSAVMTGLNPSSISSYKYGRPLSTLSNDTKPGSISVVKAMIDEVNSGNVDSIFHIGDISYATGFLVEWDFFLQQIFPLASRVSYMTAIGNHERDYPDTGSLYQSTDSGGECGVPYETYFQMPTQGKDKPWYSIEQGPIHFTLISTEHDWSNSSEQYQWMKNDMASVDRSKTPWLIFAGHRQMYSSAYAGDSDFVNAVEPLLLENKVDLAIFGHVHNYERTCAVYRNQCLGTPSKDANGIDTYNNSNYKAPIQLVVGMAGFSLDTFPASNIVSEWSLARISKFGYLRGHATRNDLNLELVNADTRKAEDSFHISKY
ncbi:hypothetical protein ACFE04_000215 [Oxalis oulophora]